MKRFVIIFVALIVFQTVFAQEDKDLEVLTQYYSQEKFQDIIKYKKNKADQLSADALYYKGLAYFMLEQDKNALEFFAKAIEKGPSTQEMYYYKGLTLLYLKEYRQALTDLNEAVDQFPGVYNVYALIGETYMQMDKPDSAILNFKKAAMFPECHVRVFLLMGEIYRKQNMNDEAVRSFQTALSKIDTSDEEYPRASFNLGLVYQLSQQYENAKAVFLHHLDLFPEDIEAVCKMIQLYTALGELDKIAPYQKILFDAAEKNNLPRHMKDMYCFDQFNWNERLVMAFEYFEENQESYISKHKYFILKEGDEIDFAVFSEKDTSKGNMDGSYRFQMIRNDTLFSYCKDIDGIMSNYLALRDTVLNILNGVITPTDTLLNYSSWLAQKQMARIKRDLGDRDGSCFEKAIIAKSISDEYEWLRKYYPGYQFIQQSLVFENDKPYDILKIKTAEGAIIEVHFDISKFFGKGF